MATFWKNYQETSIGMAVYPNIGIDLQYPTLGLIGECGEIANQVKKIIRDDNGELTDSRSKSISKEVGGALWYIAAICHTVDLSMENVAIQSIGLRAKASQNIYEEVIDMQVALSAIAQSHNRENALAYVMGHLRSISEYLGANIINMAHENMEILASRQKRGTIHGDGDNR